MHRDGQMYIAAQCGACKRVQAVETMLPLDKKLFPSACVGCGAKDVRPIGSAEMSKPAVAFEAELALQMAERG